MAEWTSSNIYITEEGQKLINQVSYGCGKMEITDVYSSSEYGDEGIAQATELAMRRQHFSDPTFSKAPSDTTSFVLQAQLHNNSTVEHEETLDWVEGSKGYYLRQIGVYGHLITNEGLVEDDKLLFIAEPLAGTEDFIPVGTDSYVVLTYAFQLNLFKDVGNKITVKVSMDNAGMLSTVAYEEDKDKHFTNPEFSGVMNLSNGLITANQNGDLFRCDVIADTLNSEEENPINNLLSALPVGAVTEDGVKRISNLSIKVCAPRNGNYTLRFLVANGERFDSDKCFVIYNHTNGEEVTLHRTAEDELLNYSDGAEKLNVLTATVFLEEGTNRIGYKLWSSDEKTEEVKAPDFVALNVSNDVIKAISSFCLNIPAELVSGTKANLYEDKTGGNVTSKDALFTPDWGNFTNINDELLIFFPLYEYTRILDMDDYDAISAVLDNHEGRITENEKYKIYYGSTGTNQTTTTKQVTIEGFPTELKPGMRIQVTFPYGNTKSSIKFKINGSGNEVPVFFPVGDSLSYNSGLLNNWSIPKRGTLIFVYSETTSGSYNWVCCGASAVPLDGSVSRNKLTTELNDELDGIPKYTLNDPKKVRPEGNGFSAGKDSGVTALNGNDGTDYSELSGGAIGSNAKAKGGGAVGENAITIAGGAVGEGADSWNGGAVGYNSWAVADGGAVGNGAIVYDGGAIGMGAESGNGFSGGKNAKVKNNGTATSPNYIDAIQLGTGTNNTAKTVQAYGYRLMEANGNIPDERLTENVRDKLAKYEKYTIYYGTTNSLAGTQDKVVDCSDFPTTLTEGLRIQVTFPYGNTKQYLKLNVNGTGAVPAYFPMDNALQSNDARISKLIANRGTVEFTYTTITGSTKGWVCTNTSCVPPDKSVTNAKLAAEVENRIATLENSTSDISGVKLNVSYSLYDTDSKGNENSYGFYHINSVTSSGDVDINVSSAYEAADGLGAYVYVYFESAADTPMYYVGVLPHIRTISDPDPSWLDYVDVNGNGTCTLHLPGRVTRLEERVQSVTNKSTNHETRIKENEKFKIFYGVCNDNHGRRDRTVTCPEFGSEDLVDGARIQVVFANGVTTTYMTLDVNGTGGYIVYFPIGSARVYDDPLIPKVLVGGCAYEFIFQKGSGSKPSKWVYCGATNVPANGSVSLKTLDDTLASYFDEVVTVSVDLSFQVYGSSGSYLIVLNNATVETNGDGSFTTTTTNTVGTIATTTTTLYLHFVRTANNFTIELNTTYTSDAISVTVGTSKTYSKTFTYSGLLTQYFDNEKRMYNTSNGFSAGKSSSATSGGGAVGYSASVTYGGAVGYSAHATTGGAVGYNSYATSGFAGGYNAKTVNSSNQGIDAIQLGTGTNNNEKTLQVYNYQLMDENGHIPLNRFFYEHNWSLGTSNSVASTAHYTVVMGSNNTLSKCGANIILGESNSLYSFGGTSNYGSMIIGRSNNCGLNSGSLVVGQYNDWAECYLNSSAAFGGYHSLSRSIDYAFMANYQNEALGYDCVVGRYNKVGPQAFVSGTTGYAFIVGNGDYKSRSNAFAVGYDGNLYTDGATKTFAADFAEYFEWVDGNPEGEDRVGHFVVVDVDGKVRFANEKDDIDNPSFLRRLGIVSGRPGFIGNDAHGHWSKKYLTDIYNRLVTQHMTYDTVYDDDGNIIQEAYEADEYVLNPDYDENQEYTSRADRKEWDCISRHGQLTVIDDGTCSVGGYCRPNKDGIATSSDTGIFVMKRLDNKHIYVLI